MKKTTAVMMMLLAALAAGAALIAAGGSTPVADVTASGPADTLVVAQDKPVVPRVVTQGQPVVYCCGGGPAGTATALGLAHRGHSAVVIERSDYRNVRVGDLGEHLLVFPGHANQHRTAIGVNVRSPVATPSRGIASNHAITAPAMPGFPLEYVASHCA